MQQIKVYTSAKLEHAAKLKAVSQDGFHFNARWLDTADAGRQRLKPVTHWQQENFDDIVAAHFFLLYVEPGDHLKGSLVEIGYAIGRGKKCWIAGDGNGVDVITEATTGHVRLPHRDILPWSMYRQRVRVVPSLTVALAQMRALVRPDVVTEMDGTASEAQEF
jgi:hypothetical protein